MKRGLLRAETEGPLSEVIDGGRTGLEFLLGLGLACLALSFFNPMSSWCLDTDSGYILHEGLDVN
jgi:hypothetical protein